MFEVIARAILLIEMDPEESMKRWFTSLGFTNTGYRGKPYDKVRRTDIDVFHPNHLNAKYNVISVDFDNKHALLWNHKDRRYKKMNFRDLHLNPDTSIHTEQ